MSSINIAENDQDFSRFYNEYICRNDLALVNLEAVQKWPSFTRWFDSSLGEIRPAEIFSLTDKSKFSVNMCSEFDRQAGTFNCRDYTREQFLSNWAEKGCSRTNCYLKDWHLKRESCEEFYSNPRIFSSDWLNEFWDFRPDIQDDFRFVYLGTEGSWTPLHIDVFASFSWSTNIAGVKLWYLFPPEVPKFEVYDVQQLADNQLERIPHQKLTQRRGETIFVPSGWQHQVVNLTDCVSINHNWLNAANIEQSWTHLKAQHQMVADSLEDIRLTEGWLKACQNCLKSFAGWNYTEFIALLKFIIITRWPKRKRCETLSHFHQLFRSSTLSIHLQSDDVTDPLSDDFYRMGHCLDQLLDSLYQADPQAITRESISNDWLSQRDFVAARSMIERVFTDLNMFSNYPLLTKPIWLRK